MTDEKLTELERLRRDNQELRGMIATMETLAANAWMDTWRLYEESSNNREVSTLRSVLESWQQIRGVRRLVQNRTQNEIDALNAEEKRILNSRLELLGAGR